MPWLVSSRTRHRKSFSYCGETMATRISVILSAEGFEFVFICAETVSRSAWVIRLPAAIAEVAAVAVVINVLREIPGDSSAIVGFSLLLVCRLWPVYTQPLFARIRRAWRASMVSLLGG